MESSRAETPSREAAGDTAKDSKGIAAVGPDGKPQLFALCTKCTVHHQRIPGSRATYIINSQSFAQANQLYSSELTNQRLLLSERPEVQTRRSATTDESPPRERRLLLQRAAIIRQEVLTEGSSINDMYDIKIGQLGKGSYGSVSKAKDLKTNAIRAVKIVYKPRIENITRLKREILIMKRLDHPNIIRLFEVYEDQKNLYLVMELCTGGELFDLIIKSGHFSERYAASLMKQLFSAIAYCHQNDVMHRDLKPENLLFTDPSPASILKVIDWGFAAKCSKNHKFSSVVGTPYYVAPEVLFGNYDKQCDIWSAGVILYVLLCGYPPFHGKDNKEILRKVKIGEFAFDPRHWKRVSEHAKDLVRRLLTYDPRRRPMASEAVQHPWIHYYTHGSTAPDVALNYRLGVDLLDKFRAFQRLSKLKRLSITCIAYQLTEKDIGSLHDIFLAMDKNGDGVLTISELRTALQNMQVKYGDDVQDLLESLDTDGNGTIDYTEFIAASIDHKLYEQERVCRQAFRVFDLDGDGKITVDEIHKVLGLSTVQEELSRDVVEEVVREVDLNNDGTIDFDEFMKMMKGNQRKKLEVTSAISKAKTLFARKYDSEKQ